MTKRRNGRVFQELNMNQAIGGKKSEGKMWTTSSFT